MLTLSLLRHAKSSWGEPGLDDHDRPLNKRGKRAAVAMAQAIARNAIQPDLILCSSAERTRQTLALIEPGFANRPDLTIEHGLYLAEMEDLLTRLHAVPDRYRHVMMIGHNPGLQSFACALSDTGASLDLDAMRTKFPTAALAVIRFETPHWRDIALHCGALVHYLTPATHLQ